VNSRSPLSRASKSSLLFLPAVAILFGVGTATASGEEPVAPPADTRQQASNGSVGDTTGAPAALNSSGATPGAVTVDGPAQFFTRKCGGCHTIGRGSLVGPDLLEVASWKTGELKDTVKRMEKFVGPLAPSEVDSLVKFLKDPKAAERIKAEEQRAVAAEAGTEPSSADVGRKLFGGLEPFKNKGMSCIACHRVEGHGGTMGKDLTDSFERLGESALVSTCEQPSYPVMKAIYRDRQITRQEGLHITKYLASLKGTAASHPDPPVGQYGVLGAGAFLGGLMFFYRKRNTGVRSRLERR